MAEPIISIDLILEQAIYAAEYIEPHFVVNPYPEGSSAHEFFARNYLTAVTLLELEE